MPRDVSVRRQLLGVGVLVLFGAVLVAATYLLFLWMT
jgi:hypothetical protein